MERQVFEEIVESQLALCREMLVRKGDEYATKDQLHNFRVAAKLQDCTMAEALAGMMGKHTVSIYDMITSTKDFPPETWDEKITDHINYLILLKAIVSEG